MSQFLLLLRPITHGPMNYLITSGILVNEKVTIHVVSDSKVSVTLKQMHELDGKAPSPQLRQL